MKFAVLVTSGNTSDPGEADEVHVYNGRELDEVYANPALASGLRGISTIDSLVSRSIGDLVVAGIGRPAFMYAKKAGVKVYSFLGRESEAVDAFVKGSVAELGGPTEEGGHGGGHGRHPGRP